MLALSRLKQPPPSRILPRHQRFFRPNRICQGAAVIEQPIQDSSFLDKANQTTPFIRHRNGTCGQRLIPDALSVVGLNNSDNGVPLAVLAVDRHRRIGKFKSLLQVRSAEMKFVGRSIAQFLLNGGRSPFLQPNEFHFSIGGLDNLRQGSDASED